MMNSDKLASMYAEIGRGTSKDKSRFAAEPGFSELWDRVAAEVAAKRGAAAMFDVPNEFPDV